MKDKADSMSEAFLGWLLGKLPVEWKDRMERQVKSNLHDQYAASEEWLQEETEAFFLKQGRIILAELIVIFLVLIILILGTIFFQKPIVLNRNSFGQGTKEVELSLKREKKQKKITYKLDEQKLSDAQIKQMYKQFFKKLRKQIAGNNTSLAKVTTSLNLPENIEGYPFEITYEFSEEDYIWIDGTLNKEEQGKLRKGETHTTYVTAKAVYRQYEQSKKYTVCIFPKTDKVQHGLFYKVEQYLKNKESGDRYSKEVKLPSTYKTVKIKEEQEGVGNWGIFILVLAVCLFIPVHNYLKLREDGEKCQSEAERDFPVIVHLLTLYMGAGLSFFSAVKRVGENYQKQQRQGREKKYAFERILIMEQQMNNGISQKDACYNWGMQFKTDSYQKLSLILMQSFTKGAKEAAILMETEEREAFSRRVDRAKREGEEASTRLLLPMILLLGEVMLLVMYPALIRFQGF